MCGVAFIYAVDSPRCHWHVFSAIVSYQYYTGPDATVVKSLPVQLYCTAVLDPWHGGLKRTTRTSTLYLVLCVPGSDVTDIE
jgi:hypothetical protein